jgi:hypothetical protein
MVRILSVVHLSMLCSPCDERRAVPAGNELMVALALNQRCVMDGTIGLLCHSRQDWPSGTHVQGLIKAQQCIMANALATGAGSPRRASSSRNTVSPQRAKGSRKAAASEGGGMVGVPLAVRGSGAGSAASSRLSMSRMKASTCAAEHCSLALI